MKKSLSLIFSLLLCFALAACGGDRSEANGGDAPQTPPVSQPDGPSDSIQTQQPSRAPETLPAEDGSKSDTPEEPGEGNGVLIVYFTYGENAPLADGVDASTSASIQYRGDELTGNTGLVADLIAEATGGDLFSILTTEQYPDSYDATIDVGQEERSANARPELASQLENLDSYDIVFLGFPNWWGDMPMAVYSFLDEYDLSGKTIAPFVTSGGSGFSNTISAIENAEPDATVLEGLSLRDSRSTQAEDEVSDWLARLGLAG